MDCAAEMLRYGGRIAYSTCTFSPEENEQAVARFLERHPEFHVERPVCAEHFAEGHPEWCEIDVELASQMKIQDTVRIWPHKVDGEGHFLALLVKGERSERPSMKETSEIFEDKKTKSAKKSGKAGKKNGKQDNKSASADLSDFYSFCEELLEEDHGLEQGRRFLTFGENLYLVPNEMPDMAGLKVLRPGLHVGTLKKGRLEPSHALALFLNRDMVKKTLEIGSGDQAERYLKGETLTIPDEYSDLKGWVLVTIDGYSIGFGKADRGVLKNHYPKGLRKP